MILSIIYFILFLSATVLINGLATRLSMGLLIWSIIFSVLTIPELWLIMMQFWVPFNLHNYNNDINCLTFFFTGFGVQSGID